LRVTNIAWPTGAGAGPGGSLQKSKKAKGQRQSNFEQNSRRRGRMLLNFDTDSISSFLQFYRLLQQQPRIDMRLFPQVQYLSFHDIPADWIQNLTFATDHLVRLSLQRCYLRNNDGAAELLLLGGKSDMTTAGTTVTMKTSSMRQDATNGQGATSRLIADDDDDDDDGVIEDDLVMSSSSMTVQNVLCLDMGKVTVQVYKYSSLRHLILSHCGIRDCSLVANNPTICTNPGGGHSGETFLPVGVPFFDLLPELMTIDLSHNQLVNMENILRGMNGCPCLTVVDLSHNRIRR
jgi:hypothetical protein